MKVFVSIDLSKLVQSSSTTESVSFKNIKNLINWTYSGLSADSVYQLIFTGGGATSTLFIYRNDGTEESPIPWLVGVLTGNNILNVSVLSTLSFDADVTSETSISGLKYYFRNEIINILDIQEENKTSFIIYRLNDEREKLHKTLINVDFILGSFKAPLGIKRIEVDMEDYQIDDTYNYVYIPKLKRYYYITDIQFMNNKFTRLLLQEDVLGSWQHVIRQQKAFVTRYEGSTEKSLVDVRRPLKDVLKVEYISFTKTPATDSFVNVTLNTNLGSADYKFLVSSISAQTHASRVVDPPIHSALPSLASLMSDNERVGFISFSQLSYLIDAVIDDDNIATFLNCVVALPFNPYYVYSSYNTGGVTDAWISQAPIQANDKYLCNDGKFHTMNEITQHGYIIVQGAQSYLGACPYFIIEDCVLYNPSNPSYLDYEPYTTIEVYLAFVGWVKLNTNQIIGDRILIYYTLDYKTGMGTAFIYNYTKKILIYSTNCQFGVKIDLTTTNTTEITRQKQANELNMILGLMTSALSIGIGVATENPVAVVGGVLSAGKTVASAVNSNNMLFERAQTSFGTSEGVYHSNMFIQVRKTYHQEILDSTELTNYKHLEGLPYNKYIALYNIPDYSGYYVEIADIHFDTKGYDIYPTEVDEIVQLLKGGVIF